MMIQFDIQKARQQAAAIEATTESLTQMTRNQYAETMRCVQCSWKGESAELYLKKAARLQEKMEDTSRQLSATAQAIRNAARAVELAEQAAIQLAESRGH